MLAPGEFNDLLELEPDTTFALVASGSVDADWCAISVAVLSVQYHAIAPGDCNGNGIPDICDVLSGTSLDENFNLIPDECEPACFGDLNGDYVVELADLQVVLANYGASGMTYENGDLDNDQDVDLNDLALLLTAYGDVCD